MWYRLVIIIANALLASSVWALPDGFVYVDQEIPGIRVDLLYARAGTSLINPATLS
jgi:hypothetical protein